LKYCAECALGVLQLHLFNYAHRDIKPENFLIANDGHVFLADYGEAKIFEDGEEELNNEVGTLFVNFLFQ
jgi:serine/threonine protein kinase